MIDNATDETIERAFSDAVNIEKQVLKNWILFYMTFLIKKQTTQRYYSSNNSQEPYIAET